METQIIELVVSKAISQLLSFRKGNLDNHYQFSIFNYPSSC